MSLDVKQIETNAGQLVTPVLANLSYQLVACEFVQDAGRWVLRLYIDKEGGVTIDDCARASHAVEDLIVAEDLVPVRYLLEVSSPGLCRPLTRREDFEKFLGERIRVKTQQPLEGRSHFNGILTGLEGDTIVILIDEEHYRVPLSAVGKARLDPELLAPRRKDH